MSKNTGGITWTDLTVENAGEIRSFYEAVVGWEPEELPMSGYSDYVMKVPGGKGVAGICHKRGGNADLPSQWLIYITVADLDRSIKSVTDLGGKVLSGPKKMEGYGRYCVIEDPAGAAAALFEQLP